MAATSFFFSATANSLSICCTALSNLPRICGDDSHTEVCGPQFAIIARLIGHFLQFGLRFGRFARIHQIAGDPEV